MIKTVLVIVAIEIFILILYEVRRISIKDSLYESLLHKAEQNDVLMRRILSRLSKHHNSESRPFAYLSPDDVLRAEELRKENTELFDYIIDIFKLYLGNDGVDNRNK